MESRSPRLPSATLTFGRLESPGACRVQAGRKCWKTPGSSMCRSVSRRIPLAGPEARKRRDCSKSWLSLPRAEAVTGPKTQNFRRPNGRRTVFWIDLRKALSAEFVRIEAHELRVSKTPAFLPLRLESGFRGNDANGHSRQFGSLPFGSIRTAELLGAFGIFDVR